MTIDTYENAPPEHVVVLDIPDACLKGVIVVHSTARGPAAGGCRLWRYANDAELTRDAMRLAEGMTYKNAVADLPLGGGKSVLLLPAGEFDRAKLFEEFGRAVADLRGSYVAAEDVGTTVDDMLSVSRRTMHVAGLPNRGGSPGGDPSPWTARGVLLAMQVAVGRRLGRPLRDCSVAIQGVGHVGLELARMLNQEGARVLVADVNAKNVDLAVAQAGATPVPVADIVSCDADVFAPCALGGVLSHSTVGSLKATVVCGAANNQLAEPEDGARLADRGVLYAPDYVVNAGGIINVAAEHLSWTNQEASRRIEDTGRRLEAVLQLAEARCLPTNLAADMYARFRILAARPPLAKAA